MMKKIKRNLDSGLHGEWEKTYKELCKAINGLVQKGQRRT
jgi:hypothetical protein